MAKKSVNAIKTIVIKAKNIVEKKELLNQMKSTYMTLQEVRFLAIYLSKINARNEKTRVVKFPLSDFTAILEIKKVNISSMQETTNRLLSKVINLPDNNGGYIGFQLFKECKVYRDKNEDWYVEIDAHDKALPLFFDLKKYVKYEVGNILRLTSTNQQRMYEILKQYEKDGVMTFKIKELRDLIGTKDTEYPQFRDFKKCVLEPCKKALKTYTDICFEYDLIKKGRGGKVIAIEFNISENTSPVQTTLDEFIANQKNEVAYPGENRLELETEQNYAENAEELEYTSKDIISFLSDACDNEFSREEMSVLHSLITKIVPCRLNSWAVDMFDYLQEKYTELNWRATQTEIQNRFGYLKKIIESVLEVSK